MAKRRTASAGKVTLKIPRPLYDKIGRAIAGAGYNSVTDFVVYVMRDLVASHEAPQARRSYGAEVPRIEGGTSKSGPADADDLTRVKQRLTALGYLGEAPPAKAVEEEDA